MSGEQNQGVGPLVGTIIIVLVLLAGGYYLFRTVSVNVAPPVQNGTMNSFSQPVPTISIPATPPQASTEITDIEADAIAVDTTPLDTGLENLDLLVK